MSASSSSAAVAPLLAGAVVCTAAGCTFRHAFVSGDPRTFAPLEHHEQRCAFVRAERMALWEREQQEAKAAMDRRLEQRRRELFGMLAPANEEKGDDASAPPLAPPSAPSLPVSVAPAAAASSPSKQSGQKRGREDELSQRDAPSASSSSSSAAAMDSDARAATTDLPPSKAPRAARSADASSAAAAVSAAAPASPSVSRSRIPQAAAAASSSSSLSAAATGSAIPHQPQQSPVPEARRSQKTGHRKIAGASSASASVRRSFRWKTRAPARDYASLGAPDPLPVFSKVSALEQTDTLGDDPHLHYAGKLIPVYSDEVYHFVSFEALFPLMVANGLLPADAPGPVQHDPLWVLSPALRMLLYFHEHHDEFSQIPRIRDAPEGDYRDPTDWTVMLRGEPFVIVAAVESTLLEQPHLSQSEYDALDDAANALHAALKPVRLAEPSYGLD